MPTVRFGVFNDVVLGTAQTRGETILQLANALLILRGFRQHRKFPRLDTRTIPEIRKTDFMNAYRIVVGGLSRQSLDVGKGEPHRRGIVSKTPSPSSSTASTASGHDDIRQ